MDCSIWIPDAAMLCVNVSIQGGRNFFKSWACEALPPVKYLYAMRPK